MISKTFIPRKQKKHRYENIRIIENSRGERVVERLDGKRVYATDIDHVEFGSVRVKKRTRVRGVRKHG